jgi:phage/plasmid-associated DNA primase
MACDEGLRPLQIEGPVLDSVASFVKARCLKRSGKEEKAADLLAAYRTWASVAGHEDISSKALGSRLADLGFERSKRGGVVRLGGLALRG